MAPEPWTGTSTIWRSRPAPRYFATSSRKFRGRRAVCFAGPRPPLRFVANELIDEAVIRLTYVSA